MSEAAAVAAPSARAKEAPSHTEYTYFLAIDDVHELKIAEAYVRAKYPNTLARVTRQLPLNRLNQHAIVIPLIRGEDRTSVEEHDRDRDGAPRVTRHKPAELISEVRELAPIKTGSFWRKVVDVYDAFGGELDRDSFHNHLGSVVSPCVAKTHIGSLDVMRILFV